MPGVIRFRSEAFDSFEVAARVQVDVLLESGVIELVGGKLGSAFEEANWGGGLSVLARGAEICEGDAAIPD